MKDGCKFKVVLSYLASSSPVQNMRLSQNKHIYKITKHKFKQVTRILGMTKETTRRGICMVPTLLESFFLLWKPFVFFKTGSHYVALAVVELTM